MGFEILVSANFAQMYLWIHDKYSSTSFKRYVWQRKLLLRHLFSASVAQWSGRFTLAQEADYCVASNLRMDMFVYFVHFFKSHFYLGGLWRAQFKKWLSFFSQGAGVGGGGVISWEVVVGVHRPPHLIFTLFQSNIYKVNVREFLPRDKTNCLLKTSCSPQLTFGSPI